MNPRSQLRHMLIDVDFFSNPKIRALGRQYGAIGKLTVIEIYCAMSRATNAIIDEDAFLVIAEDNGVEDSLDFLKYCLDKKLIIKDGEGYSNSVVIADQESYARSLERKSKDSERKRKGNPAEILRNADTDIDTDIDNNNINKNSAPEYVPHTQPKDEIPEDADEALKAAYAELEAPTNQSWTLTNAYMLSGRRPLKKYPEVFLTPIELSDIFKNLNEKVPKNQWKPIFQRVQARVKKQCHDQHRKPDQVYPYDWLMSFEVTKQLEQVIQTKRLESIEARR